MVTRSTSVHGEFRFAALQMPPPADAAKSGGRLSGLDMCNYMETFAQNFLKGNIRFETEVLDIRRHHETSFWCVTVEDKHSGRDVIKFARIVLCTGVRRHLHFKGLY